MIKIKKSHNFIYSSCCLGLLLAVMIGFTGWAQPISENDPQIGFQLEKSKQKTVQANAENEKEKKAPETASEKKEEKNIVEEERDLMEKALEILDMADNYWKKGDIENALNNLDKAYALVLDTNGDIEIARQKDDLRLLISKRILALYSTQNTKTNGKASEIPYLINDDVEKEIRSFQTFEREFFIGSYKRSAMYHKIIIEELRKAGIPEELFWLPLVESGFKVNALSPARALGLWQFIPSTGYKYGLSRDEWMDERMDVLKSTQAAIAYLKELHGMFGDWLTVLAAYNCGEGKVLRVISHQRINYFDRFWDLYRQLPHETARYVPRFLATLHIVKNPEKYGFDLKMEPEVALDYEKVKTNKMMKLSDIASKMEVSEDVMNTLNAELRYKITPNRDYEFKIPKDLLQKFNEVYADIPEAERPYYTYKRASFLRHRVRSGETVASIAKRYKVPRAVIMDNNRISKSGRLKRGQVIRIPVYRSETAATKRKSSARKSDASYNNGGGSYKIKPGDSLLSIARKHNVSVAKLKELNHLKSNKIQAGHTLKIPGESTNNKKDSDKDGSEKETPDNTSASIEGKTKIASKTLTSDEVAQLGSNKHIVTKGENLSLIAKKYHIEISKIVEWNNISSDETLTPGQILTIKK